jgi:V/A-type H+-transporting ATPase subunit I
MIVPMKKYSFLVYHREYLGFLSDLQELGVLHVIEKKSGEIEDEGLREKFSKIQQLNNAINFLQKREIEPSQDVVKTDGTKILEEIRGLQSDKDQYLQQLVGVKKELSLIEPWGEFTWEIIDNLKKAGINARFLTCPSKKFSDDWRNNYYVEVIKEIKGQTYFILFEKSDEKTEIDAEEISLPHRSLSQISEQIKEIEAILEKTEKLFDKYAANSLDALTNAKKILSGELSFEKVILNTHKEAEDKLMILEGWVPDDKAEVLITYLGKKSVYYNINEASKEDTIPIKLKNNWFSRLFEPIGELYSLPQYSELDLTPFFAPFFMLFFGFCLGDIGYGLLILIATIFVKPKVKPKIRPIITLGQFLGISTIIMGLVSGTFFGINLLETDFLFFPSLRFMMLDSKQLMTLALIIGGVQIIFGISLKAAKIIIFEGFRASLATLGWIVVISGNAAIYFLSDFGYIDKESTKNLYLIICIIGGIPILFLNSPGKNIFLNVGLGLWDSYGMLSGLLGDLLSYIRLFALGISSAVLGLVFNQIAVELSGDIPVVSQIIMILILLFGHSLNLGLSALGSFVHPMRLTFVEFYKNSGFSGGGLKYRPFIK